jgi:hypothetical protein
MGSTRDVKKIGEKGSAAIKSQIAWCTAQLGDPARAADLIHSVLPQMQIMGPEYSGSAQLVLGVSNFLMDKAAEAVPHLEDAYTSASAHTSRKATAAFYLGESYAALGNASGARQAYQNSAETLPNGRFGIRASKRLAGLGS